MADLQAIGLSNADFGVDLFRKISQANPDSNVFISPLSILIALAMTLLGAKDKTEAELKSVLKLDRFANDAIHPYVSELIKHLQNTNGNYELNIANKLYGEQSYDFLKQFTGDIKKHYGTDLEAVDFKFKAKQYVDIINKWVENKTKNKIKNLLSKDSLNQLTTLVIVNAIYFKGTWKTEFDSKRTILDRFYSSEKQSVEASFMHFPKMKLNYYYHNDLGSQVLELPYVGDTLSFIVILPNLAKTDFASVEKQLTGEMLAKVDENLIKQNLKVWLPKFKLELQHDVSSKLKELGLVDLFSEIHADLSGMSQSDERNLFVTDVIHKTFIEIDEKGTEAAAATAVIVGKTAMKPVMPIEFKADHPFIFLIKDKLSGAVLFLGKLMKP